MGEAAYQIDLGAPTTDDCVWFVAKARGKASGPRLVALCDEMERQQATLIENTDRCIAVFQYGGDAKDLDPQDHYPIDEASLTYNAAQNAVETVHAKVIKSRIAPMPLTNGGGYLQRHRAKEMGKAIEGVLDESECDQIEEDVMMDALVTDHGAGAIKVLEVRGRDGEERVKLEHVPIEDVWFDEAEIRQRKPSCTYHVPRDGYDAHKVLELYAREGDDYPGLVGTVESRRAAILSAASKRDTSARGRKVTPMSKYRVDVYEAWHPPTCFEEYDEDEEYDDEETGEKATRKVRKVKHDGRHVVAVPGPDGTLIDEPWEEDHAPILLMVPRPRRRSIWGLSLMRSLLAPQREYEKVTLKIQHQHQKMGVSGFSAPKQAEVNVREITAGTFGAGFLMEHEGPVGVTPLVTEPVAQGTYAYAESIPRNMLERNGISTLSASSQVPAGLSQASGKALQVFEDFEDVRLISYHRARERWKVALSWMIVRACKRIVERNGSYRVGYRGKQGLEHIDWKDFLDLIKDKDSFVLKVFPVSQLSKQPAAKFAQLTELLNAGAITVEQFKRLFELPDLEAENQLDTADTDVIDRAMDIMVTTGRYLSPEPFDNLDLIIQRAGKFYNLCRQQEVPENRLQLLRDYMEDAKTLKTPPAPEAMPGAPAGMPPPGGPTAGPGGMAPPDGPLPGMPGAPPAPLPMAA